jgi:hypothetical protein
MFMLYGKLLMPHYLCGCRPIVLNVVAVEYMCFFSKLRIKIIILGAILPLSFTAINSNMSGT